MTPKQLKILKKAVLNLMPTAEKIFEDVKISSWDKNGVTRAAWSLEDQAAASILLEAAKQNGLVTRTDCIGNTYAILKGSDVGIPGILTGSHLDSVAHGGNYDGLAGAIAGIIALAALKHLGIVPKCQFTAMGIRCEESVWFGTAYIGARLSVGSLSKKEFSKFRRSDSGRSISSHMKDLGIDADDIWRLKSPEINVSNTKAFLELHIEQGPLLLEKRAPLGIATAIRGNLRYPDIICNGSYQHSAATPRRLRRDAVLAVADFLHQLENVWHDIEDNDDPSAVVTIGKIFTDPEYHALTKVPGKCHFSLNCGSTEQSTLDRMAFEINKITREISTRRNVQFTLGKTVGSPPTYLTKNLRLQLIKNTNLLNEPSEEFATAGHDASIFARAGIPSAVLLVRNAEGSHNPKETMDLDDFALGVIVLAATMIDLADQ